MCEIQGDGLVIGMSRINMLLLHFKCRHSMHVDIGKVQL
jgi:hypothetical protein